MPQMFPFQVLIFFFLVAVLIFSCFSKFYYNFFLKKMIMENIFSKKKFLFFKKW